MFCFQIGASGSNQRHHHWAEVSICTFFTKVLRISIVLTGLRTYEAILTDLLLKKNNKKNKKIIKLLFVLIFFV